jgi:nucleotide-binding universal stress UspA family protein
MEYTLKNILFATDLGPHGPEIFKHAAGLAQQFGAKIYLIHVAEPLSEYAQSLVDTYVPDHVLESLRKEGYEKALSEMHRRLEAFCKDKLLAGTEQLIADMRVAEGFPAQVILEEAKRIGADIIVLGSHGQSALSEMLLGSVAHRVIMKSTLPVLLVPIKRG